MTHCDRQRRTQVRRKLRGVLGSSVAPEFSVKKPSKELKSVVSAALVVNTMWETACKVSLPEGLEDHVFKYVAVKQKRLGALSPTQYHSFAAEAVEVFMKNRLPVEAYMKWKGITTPPLASEGLPAGSSGQ